jgi:hypothetical protein
MKTEFIKKRKKDSEMNDASTFSAILNQYGLNKPAAECKIIAAESAVSTKTAESGKQTSRKSVLVIVGAVVAGLLIIALLVWIIASATKKPSQPKPTTMINNKAPTPTAVATQSTTASGQDPSSGYTRFVLAEILAHEKRLHALESKGI